MSKQISLFGQAPGSPAEIGGGTALAATLPVFAEYLRRQGKSVHTITAFRGDLNLLAEFAGADTALQRLRTEDLGAFLVWMEHERGVPCSRKTYARRVTSLKVYFKWLRDIEALPHDLAQPLRQRSGPAPLSVILDAPQVESCIVAARTLTKGGVQDYRPEALFRLLLETGIKKAEAGRLTLADIERGDPEAPLLFIRHKARGVYKERRIELPADLLDLLDKYIGQYSLQERVFDCTTRNLEYILTDIGERAAVPFKLSFEVMRWTMAVRDYLAGSPEDDIREKMGLSRISWYETGAKIRQLAGASARQ